MLDAADGQGDDNGDDLERGDDIGEIGDIGAAGQTLEEEKDEVRSL